MVRSEIEGQIHWVVLDRPERLNAFTGAAYRAVRVALDEAAANDAVRCVVLTGAGRAFSAGADRSLVDGSASVEEREEAGREFEPMLEAFGRCPKPVVAAVNGVAVGIGCTLLLHCDLVLLAASARLRTPFTALGVAPEAASSVLLPLRTRWADATWMLLSSEWVDADAAHAMGLAWRVVPDDRLLAEARGAATTLAGVDPAAVAATKRLLAHGRADLVAAACERERRAMRDLLDGRSVDAVTDPGLDTFGDQLDGDGAEQHADDA